MSFSALVTSCVYMHQRTQARDNLRGMTSGTKPATSTTEDNLDESQICVICLDAVVQPGTARPCQHDQFHFSCLGSWLRTSKICPLCKQDVAAISFKSAGRHVDVVLARPSSTALDRHRTARPQSHQSERQSSVNTPRIADDSDGRSCPTLAVRRRVYENNMRCTYVGSNAITGYRSITARTVAQDPQLVSKAKRWLRRELQVFDFLCPCVPWSPSSSDRTINAEYLLEYIVSLLKSIDIKDSGGQAESLLAEHIGRRHAQVFLHELESWLRSPYDSLGDWDDNVQY